MIRIRLIRCMLSLVGLLAAALPGAALAETNDTRSESRVVPLIPCDERLAPELRDDNRCVDPMMMKASNDRILAIKTAAANAYAEWQEGRASRQQLDMFERWLAATTGERPVEAQVQQPALPAPGQNARMATRKTELSRSYWPFQQVNSYYCGPATVQSILNFLGVQRSETVNGLTGRRESLTGRAEEDQATLAGEYWLATDKYNGTNWGELYVPFTLNAWLGNRWYVQAATPTLEGGKLTKQQALNNIKYATDRSYPVAENVLYSTSTYYPAGFWPGIRYEHWDTVYGHVKDGETQYVQVGQTYGDNRLKYDRFQQIAWDVHWTAIEAWYGIVW